MKFFLSLFSCYILFIKSHFTSVLDFNSGTKESLDLAQYLDIFLSQTLKQMTNTMLTPG